MFQLYCLIRPFRRRFTADGTAVDSRLAGKAGRPIGFASFLGFVALAFLLPTSALGQPSAVQSVIEQGQAAGADTELMRNVASRAEKAGVGPEQTAELLRPAVTLAERDLPTRPLLNKTLEGLAKRVPPARMGPVLQRLQTNTEEAGALVSTWLNQDKTKQLVGESAASSSARTQLITTVTEAQQQEIPLKTVKQFLDGLPGGVERSVSVSQVATVVSVMPDLPGGKSNPKVAQQLLTSALNAGYDSESMRQLPAALERAQRETQRPSSAIAKGAAQVIAQGTPAASVLRSLFQGSMPGGGPPSGVGNGPPASPPGQGRVPSDVDRGPDDNPEQGDGDGNPGGGQGGG
jgi:hypothetical protein